MGISMGTLISLIVTVAVLLTVASVGIRLMQSTNQAEESFVELIDHIEALEDGADAVAFVYQLPSEYALVHFIGGKTFNGKGNTIIDDIGNPCAEIVLAPDVCTSNCLAVCSGAWKTSWEEACTDDLVAYEIIEEGLSFTDTSCGSGLYREGQDNNVMTIYLKKVGNQIYVCDTKSCLGEDEDEVAKEFETFVSAYQTCQEDSNDCSCDLDLSFLKDEYAVNFKEDKIELLEISGGKVIVNKDFETKFAKSTALTIETSDEYSVYQAEVTEYSADTVGGSSIKTTSEYVLVSPGPDNINNENLVGLSDKQNPVSSTLYQKNREMVLVKDGYSFTGVTTCGEEQPQVVASANSGAVNIGA
jgi:hypothetical protein